MSWILGQRCHRGQQRAHAWRKVQPRKWISLNEMGRLPYPNMTHTILVTICLKQACNQRGHFMNPRSALCLLNAEKTSIQKENRKHRFIRRRKPQWYLGRQWDRGEVEPRWKLQALLSLHHPWSTFHLCLYGRKSADCTEHGNYVIFFLFLATVFGYLEVWKVKKWNIFLKYISAAV